MFAKCLAHITQIFCLQQQQQQKKKKKKKKSKKSPDGNQWLRHFFPRRSTRFSPALRNRPGRTLLSLASAFNDYNCSGEEFSTLFTHLWTKPINLVFCNRRQLLRKLISSSIAIKRLLSVKRNLKLRY